MRHLKKIVALIALFPLAYGAVLMHAQAEGERADVKELALTVIEDTQDNRQKHPYLQAALFDQAMIEAAKPDRPTVLSVGEIKDAVAGDMSFVYANGPLYCGASNCQFAGYKGAKEVINVAVQMPVYVQACPGALSLLFADGEPAQVGKWVYNGDVFEFEESYAGMENVPPCK